MKASKFLLIAGLVLTFSVSGSIALRNIYQSSSAQQRLKAIQARVDAAPPVVPVTVFYEERLSKAGFPDSVGNRKILAVKADGSISEVDNYHAIDGRLFHTTRNLSLKGGLDIKVDDTVHTIVAQQLPDIDWELTAGRYDPTRDCSIRFNDPGSPSAVAGHEEFLGYDAIKIVYDKKSIRSTHWRVPSLGCVEVRRLAQFRNQDGSISDTSDLVAINIQPGEPDASLFSVPAYQRVSPVETVTRYMKARGADAATIQAQVKAMQQAEEQWKKHQYTGELR